MTCLLTLQDFPIHLGFVQRASFPAVYALLFFPAADFEGNQSTVKQLHFITPTKVVFIPSYWSTPQRIDQLVRSIALSAELSILCTVQDNSSALT